MRKGHPLSSMRSQRTACMDEVTHNRTDAPRRPPKQRVPPSNGIKGRGGERGARLQPKEEGGAPPEQARTPFVHSLIQEIGGHPQDL